MMENTNETIQNLEDAVMRDMAQNVDKVDDADDFYYEDPNSLDEMIYSTNPEQTVNLDEIAKEVGLTDLQESISDSVEEVPEMKDEEVEEKALEAVPEAKDFELTNEELEKISEASSDLENKEIDTANFDALFDSLYSDVTGANNFISNLIEQKKTVNINEANLVEMQDKLEKDKEEFAKFVEAQKEAIELEKAQCKEYVRTQKARVANEEAQFNSDVEATRAELALAEQTLKINNEKLADERQQFSSYKELEEEKLKSDKQRLESEKSAFAKEKAITEEKLKSDRIKLETERDQFTKEKTINDDKLLADRQAL